MPKIIEEAVYKISDFMSTRGAHVRNTDYDRVLSILTEVASAQRAEIVEVLRVQRLDVGTFLRNESVEEHDLLEPEQVQELVENALDEAISKIV